MSKIIYIAIGFLLGAVFAKWRFESQIRTHNASNPLNQQRAEEHQRNLDRILSSFGSDEEITNDKVEKMLGVSNTSAERYLDELEKAGKLQQIGHTGKYVTYRKI